MRGLENRSCGAFAIFKGCTAHLTCKHPALSGLLLGVSRCDSLLPAALSHLLGFPLTLLGPIDFLPSPATSPLCLSQGMISHSSALPYYR